MEDKAGEISIFNYGGLIRDVTIYAVPEVHLTRMHCDTVFDRSFTDAALTVHLSFAGAPDEVRLQLEKRMEAAFSWETIKTERIRNRFLRMG